jgi:acetate kinase
MRVLVLNPGSSSLKSSVVESDSIPTAGADGRVPAAPATALAPLGQLGVDWGVDATAGGDPTDDIRALLAKYEAEGIAAGSLGAVGYRVVHGGTEFRQPVVITPEVVAQVRALTDLAPLHNGLAAATMTAGLAAIPALPHVAVFDTAFHATLPEEAYRYPVPERWYRDWGVRRYGFHGISVAWSAERAAALLDRPIGELRTVVAHLGSGCSVTAVDGGRSVATSMGLTPLEGLMMGTRAGSIDPGILFYLLRTGRLDGEELAEELDHASGLMGVSGRTSDVRELLRLESSGDGPAALALKLFVRRAAECIASAATALPQLDAIVFTGGIGENAAVLRARIVARLGSIGVAPITEERPAEDAVLAPRSGPAAPSAPTASATNSPAVLRIVAREDLVVAREAARLVGAAKS